MTGTTASTPPRPRLRHLRRPLAVLALAGCVLLLALVLAGPSLFGDAARTTAVADRLLGPSARHPFGTDEIGRDVLARTVVAAQLSLLLTLGATVVSVGGGVLVALVAVVLPRHPRRLLVAANELLLAFPWLLLVLFFTAVWGAGAVGAMLAIGLAGIPSTARLVYTLASSVTGRDYVRAAKVVGVGPVGVLVRHVLPNTAGPLLVNTAATASVTLLSFAGLSFLGLGVQAPAYDWGRLLREGTLRIYDNPMAALGPGLAVVVAGLVFTVASEAISEVTTGGAGAGTGRGAGRRLRRGAARRTTTSTPVPAPATAAEAAAGPAVPVAEVRGLHVSFPDGAGGEVTRVHGVDVAVDPGETLGIVGESGSGKTVTAMALAGLLEAPARVEAEVRVFDGIDLSRRLSRADAGRVGAGLAMVFQDPLTSLNPALTIGRQLTEVPEVHLGVGRGAARRRAVDALRSVRIADPERRVRRYPHELSGGMRQRAMIAMGLTGAPKLLVADEPTTALDVTVQKQVMAVLRTAQRETGAAVVLISHDLALVSAFCDRVLVMKDGAVVEEVDARRIRTDARHPYTRALVRCLPDMASDRTRPLPVVPADVGAAELAVDATDRADTLEGSLR